MNALLQIGAVGTLWPANEPLGEQLKKAEAAIIKHALSMNDGVRVHAARQLGITREGLYRKMKRLGIDG